ncbi:hypothetical protein H3C70_01130 [Patescibacteria group bacterium]|nr:hypothetical protein [Patescibacteria group bacterium]
MGLFGLGKKKDEEGVNVDQGDHELLDQLDELQRNTEEVEAEKEAKRLAREERKFLKDTERKRKQKERFVAPVLLILTIAISLVLWMMNRG